MDSAAASLKASPADENSAQAAHLVGLGVASGSGPHSVMEVIQDSDAISESHHQASERPASLVASDSVPGETTLGHRRPPPLNVTMEPLPGSADGPKTPLSPRTRSGMSRIDREKKIGHRRVGEAGEVTYKKIHTTTIMGSIQLGIGHAVGGLASKPDRDVLVQDFITIETTNFSAQGSQLTPAHHYSDFRFKTYGPNAFRYFRDLFGIQPDDFLLSLCNEPLRELSNPGASGSIFYLSADDEFIIKTVQHKEGEFLMKLLLGYYMNLNQNPRTLLPKFFGLYCYQCNSKNVRMVVMNNLLPSAIKMHEKYDLKGSTYKRKASKSERSKSVPTYKDLDFMEIHPEGILLEADTYTALTNTIKRDCRVLESFKIMDYSLLVGIHNLDLAAREEAERRRANSTGDDETSGDESAPPTAGTSASAGACSSSGGGGGPPLVRSRSINRQKLVAHSTALESIQAESEPIDEEDDVPPGGIPARNAKGERLLLFLGIIDILQSYRLKKKLEHTLKAMIHDGDSVSVHRPGFYSQRFRNFMSNTVFKKVPSPLKHSPSKKKLAAAAAASAAAAAAAAANSAASAASTAAAAAAATRTRANQEQPGDPSTSGSQESVTFRPSVARAGAGSLGATDGYSLPSSSSTPPPAFDDVPRSPGSVSAGRGSAAAAAAPSSARSSSHASLRSRHGPAAGVLWNSHTESVSLSEVQLEASGVASAAAAAMGSVGSKVSSLSGGSLSVRLTSTAPTPTWTEGSAASPEARCHTKETTIVYEENEMTHL